jgi:hypothetical protein
MSPRPRDGWRAAGWARAAILANLCALALCGCRRETPAEPPAVSDSAERGPLKLVTAAAPSQVWIGDEVRVTLTVHTPAGYLVQFPSPAAFGGLSVAVLPEQLPRPTAEGGAEWRQEYSIATFASGTLEIPPLAVQYARQPEDGRAPDFDGELATGTLNIEVRSALTSQDSVTNPRDITGTIALSQRWPPWAIGLTAGAAAALLIGGWLLFRAWRAGRMRPAPPELPEVLALRALQALAARDWIAAGQAREYYYRLSEIVRQYIEARFALAAPEMTTEEFLAQLLRDRSALPYDAGRLGEFLEACDMVKYAALEPGQAEATRALEAARAFIHATAAATAHVPGRAASATAGAAA